MKIAVILTCFNRKEKTEQCIRKIAKGNPEYDFSFVVVDDCSNDGTFEKLQDMQKEFDIRLLKTDGDAYYSGGMRMGMKYALENLCETSSYVLLINDDVSFYENFVKRIINQSKAQKNAVVVGATCNEEGNLSYSAIKYIKGISYKKLSVTDWEIEADTFNANCVLIPVQVFLQAGQMDAYYIHSLGDFDYGLQIKRSGAVLHVSKEYVGVCNNNSTENTWVDTTLTRRERMRKKEQIKGAPAKQWFYFLKKNFGLFVAVKGSITPYIRILIGK